jgi:urease accessory protein
MRRFPLAAVAGLLFATPAFAHTGQGDHAHFVAGFLHPVTGLDHTLAMLGVGLWAGLALKRDWWLWPAAFVGFMTAGFALGVGGGPLPGVEAVIAASVVALGLAVAFNLKAPAMAGAAAVAVFGLAHGYAHGQELPAGASGLGFAAGFVIATVALHLAGFGLSVAARRLSAPAAARVAGAGLAMAGLALGWMG